MQLRLLGCFRFAVDGQRVEIPAVSARILAYLGVRGEEVERSAMARVLWPHTTHSRSLGNLRSALWRLPTCSRNAVSERGTLMSLDPDVRCDLELLEHNVASTVSKRVADVVAWGWCDELLAGWYDDWVLSARESFQVRRAMALERLSGICCTSGLHRDAVLYATLAVAAQPMRESAHQALLRAHIDHGNAGEATRLYRELVTMLEGELGVTPSPDTLAIMATIGDDVA